MQTASDTEASTVWPFQVRALTPRMGAEISGIDFSTDLSAETLQAVHRAFLQYQVLVFQPSIFPLNNRYNWRAVLVRCKYTS